MAVDALVRYYYNSSADANMRPAAQDESVRRNSLSRFDASVNPQKVAVTDDSGKPAKTKDEGLNNRFQDRSQTDFKGALEKAKISGKIPSGTTITNQTLNATNPVYSTAAAHQAAGTGYILTPAPPQAQPQSKTAPAASVSSAEKASEKTSEQEESSSAKKSGYYKYAGMEYRIRKIFNPERYNLAGTLVNVRV